MVTTVCWENSARPANTRAEGHITGNKSQAHVTRDTGHTTRVRGYIGTRVT